MVALVPNSWKSHSPLGLRTPTIVAEVAILFVAAIMPFTTYFVLGRADPKEQLLSAPASAFLLLANLLPFVALIVLIGRRFALHRATKSALAGGGSLHVRLVVMFTLMASVPIMLTVIAASVMFQSGVQLWGGERARNAFNSTIDLAREGQRVILKRWTGEALYMARDLALRSPEVPTNSIGFRNEFLRQTYYRNFFQSVLFRATDAKRVKVLYAYEAPPETVFSARVSGQILGLKDGEIYTNYDARALWVVTPVDRARDVFLYVSTPNDIDFLRNQDIAASRLITEYDGLRSRARSLQLQFNAVLLGVALLIIGITTWIALAVADRLVRPVNELVDAARRVEGGDLTARVAAPGADDEVGRLANAFNAMTDRLQQQTGALVAANDQLDSRRALIEAVMSGVTAGVVSISDDRTVRLINSSAATLLGTTEPSAVGRPLATVSPELNGLLDNVAREAVIQVNARGEPRTLAVKITGDDAGQVLTFDDITQQLLDQRRAAWSDVARRIAHEIKNPLTPIQLAAERLQRRYGKQINSGDGTFARLTETIIRQVGDLRRIVDEFSSFARMPKPIFREESLVDIARQTLFLHEVAHGHIQFSLVHDDPPPTLVCDRRQLGQALTNIVKNAIEAIETRGGDGAGEVTMTLATTEQGQIRLSVADNGVGLPVERDRIVEPYMTTRARGTGLGLAIVKKIVEEHFGTIAFTDREGGGTVVTLCFDTAMLANLDRAAQDDADAGDDRLAELTRNRSN